MSPAPRSDGFTEAPETVLELLEADQVVAVKEHSRFSRRPISRRLNLLLWALRIYVLIMLALVAVSVYQALR